MKVHLVALATLAVMSAAAPAYAAYSREAPRQPPRQEEETFAPPQASGMSQYCRDVLARPDMAGDRQVRNCQEIPL